MLASSSSCSPRDVPSAVPQLHPIPGQRPQVPDRRRCNERRAKLAVLQQLGDPPSVLDICLTHRDRFHMRGVEQPALASRSSEA
jgi:hypothetical protein